MKGQVLLCRLCQRRGLRDDLIPRLAKPHMAILKLAVADREHVLQIVLIGAPGRRRALLRQGRQGPLDIA